MPLLDGMAEWQRDRYQAVIKKYGLQAYLSAKKRCVECQRKRNCSNLVMDIEGKPCRYFMSDSQTGTVQEDVIENPEMGGC